jgi:lauroyl/myristoyl acyltransferase
VSRRPLRSGLKRIAARWPQPSLAAASAVAWSTQALGRGVSVEALHEVLPDLDRAELDAARRATWSSSLRRAVLAAALSVPGASRPYPRLVRGPDPSAIPAPAVLATFHVGPLQAMGLLFERLAADVLVLQAADENGFPPPRPGFTRMHVGDDEWQRALVFRDALKALHAGNYVCLAVDGYGAPQLAAPLLGRRVRLARGAFALARMTGAPIIPTAPRWRGTGIEIVAGDPVAPGDDPAMAAALTRWLESFVRESPGEIMPALVALLREGAPLADAAVEEGVAQPVVADLAVSRARDRAWRHDGHQPGYEAG